VEIRRIVESAHMQAREILATHRDALNSISEVLLKRETIEADEFEALLEGRSEEDVFGTEAPPPPQLPATPERAPRESGPKPLPRPGFAAE
jgi:cell division protease FtsH